MSWHFSLALEAEFSAASCLDGEPDARLKSMPIAPDDLCSDKMKGICHRSPFGTMYAPSTDGHGAALLTWFLEASLAPISAQRGKRRASMATTRLWLEYARIVRQVRPRFVWVENSSRLINSGLGRILSDLAAMGFDARWGVLGSNFVGADHQRLRTWVLADSMPWLQPVGRNISGSRRQPKQVKEYANRETLCEPGFLGKPHGMADRMDRNRAIGNGQDPRVVAAAWGLLA